MLNKYLKYLIYLLAAPLLILFCNFPGSNQVGAQTDIDAQLRRVLQEFSTASPNRQAQLGIADMLLYSAKNRWPQQQNLASEMVAEAVKLIDTPQDLGNPAYWQFTANQNNNSVNFYAISTSKIAYLFVNKKNKLDLESVFYPSEHHPFIKSALESRPFWKADFSEANRRKLQISSLSNVNANLSGEPELFRGSNYTALNFKWLNANLEDQVTNIEIELRLADNSEKSSWLINVEPQKTKASKVLYEVEFPILPNITKKPNDSREDYLVVPFQSGQLFIDPSQTVANSKNKDFQYPGKARWQSLVYYQGEQGLNFMVTDPDGYSKKAITIPNPSQKSINLSWAHQPQGMGYPNSKFKMFGAGTSVNYSCDVSTFKGDWYTAAQIYRTWMLEQNFLGNGKPTKLATNSQVPDWVKKLVISYRSFSVVGTNERQGGLGGDQNEVSQIYQFHRENLPNVTGQISLYKWGNLPKDQPMFYDRPEVAPYLGPYLGQAIATLKSAQLHPAVYVESDLWDQKGTTYKAENGENTAIVNYDGKIKQIKLGSGDKQRIFSVIDTYERQWINKQTGIMTSLLSPAPSQAEKIEGIFFDRGLTNSDLNHRNANTVGGNRRAQGWKDLVVSITKQARSFNPDFTVFSEGMADCYLNLNNVYLYFDREVPFDVALWGDYSSTYGTEADWPAEDDQGTENDWQQALPFARTLAWGQPIGRLYTRLLSDHPEVTPFFLEMAKVREANLDYLGTGRLLKPLTINQVSWSRPPSPAIPKDQLPDIMIPHGVFAHSNPNERSVLFVLANGVVKNSTANLDLTIDPANYSIPSNYQLYRRTVTPEGTVSDTVVGSFINGSINQKLAIAPMEIVTYVAKP